jgi:hypothetical protein
MFTSARIRKMFGILFLVLGVGMCAADILFVWYLWGVSPMSQPTSSGEVIQDRREARQFLVSKEGDLVMGILFGTGLVVAGLGGRLWKENVRLG